MLFGVVVHPRCEGRDPGAAVVSLGAAAAHVEHLTSPPREPAGISANLCGEPVYARREDGSVDPPVCANSVKNGNRLLHGVLLDMTNPRRVCGGEVAGVR